MEIFSIIFIRGEQIFYLRADPDYMSSYLEYKQIQSVLAQALN